MSEGKKSSAASTQTIQPGVPKEVAFGYGFLLAGIALPYLIEKGFGPFPATVIACVCLVGAVFFLIIAQSNRNLTLGRTCADKLRRAALLIILVVSASASLSFVAWKLIERGYVTSGNVKNKVQEWISDARWQVEDLPPRLHTSAGSLMFGYAVTLPSGNHILIYRGRDRHDFIQLQSIMPLTPQELGRLNALTQDKAEDAMEEIQAEFLREKIGYTLKTDSDPPWPAPNQPAATKPVIKQQTITLGKALPISELTEVDFVNRVDEMDETSTFVHYTRDLVTKRNLSQCPCAR